MRLKLGWCAVVNRSQFDINADVDMSAARANERAFFDANRDKYSIVNCGTGVLTEMLTGILGDSIRRRVPRIRETIDGAAAALEQELRCLGTSVPSDRVRVDARGADIVRGFRKGVCQVARRRPRGRRDHPRHLRG